MKMRDVINEDKNAYMITYRVTNASSNTRKIYADSQEEAEKWVWNNLGRVIKTEPVAEDKEMLPAVDTPTVAQVAKKHGVSSKEILKQLGMGIKVEYEHTKNKALSREIALDHLNELPDYYTKLKDMEGNH